MRYASRNSARATDANGGFLLDRVLREVRATRGAFQLFPTRDSCWLDSSEARREFSVLAGKLRSPTRAALGLERLLPLSAKDDLVQWLSLPRAYLARAVLLR
jgi:hypothetical protein